MPGGTKVVYSSPGRSAYLWLTDGINIRLDQVVRSGKQRNK